MRTLTLLLVIVVLAGLGLADRVRMANETTTICPPETAPSYQFWAERPRYLL